MTAIWNYDNIRTLNVHIFGVDLSDADEPTRELLFWIGTCNVLTEWEQEHIEAANQAIELELRKARENRRYIPNTKYFEEHREEYIEKIKKIKERRNRYIAELERRLPEGQLEMQF